jgi:DNA-binding response OmpR family regulator
MPIVAARSLPLVLLVDDEPDQVEMYQLGLELAGFEVISAFTGTDGIRLAIERSPDAIVLDVRLPDLTGWDVCRILNADPRTAGIPILILTAAATATLPDQVAGSGCAAYLLKPCFPDHLARRVREVIAPQVRAPEV